MFRRSLAGYGRNLRRRGLSSQRVGSLLATGTPPTSKVLQSPIGPHAVMAQVFESKKGNEVLDKVFIIKKGPTRN